MLSSKSKVFKISALMLGLLALVACGFQPAYGPNGPAANLQGSIEVDAPKTRDGFDFVRRLEDRLGQPQAVNYTLSYTLNLSQDGLAITPAQVTTRYNILGAADYSIRDLNTGQVVHSGTVNSFTSYSATGTTVSTSTAKSSAYSRLMIILADQITTRLIATSGNWLK